MSDVGSGMMLDLSGFSQETPFMDPRELSPALAFLKHPCQRRAPTLSFIARGKPQLSFCVFRTSISGEKRPGCVLEISRLFLDTQMPSQKSDLLTQNV